MWLQACGVFVVGVVVMLAVGYLLQWVLRLDRWADDQLDEIDRRREGETVNECICPSDGCPVHGCSCVEGHPWHNGSPMRPSGSSRN